jgi:hypothetical protein
MCHRGNVAVETAPASARQRVTVIADEGAAFGTPRLLLRSAPGRAAPGIVTWELCYGGLPICSGSMSGDQELLFAEIGVIQPEMDSLGLTLAARHEDGQPAAIEATCVRPALPPTRAEALARVKWAGARDQHEAPAPRQPFLAEAREALPPVRAGQGGAPRRRRVCIYQHFSVLLAQRRGRLRKGGPRHAGDRADGTADA